MIYRDPAHHSCEQPSPGIRDTARRLQEFEAKLQAQGFELTWPKLTPRQCEDLGTGAGARA